MSDQALRLLIPEFRLFSTNSPVHNHGSQNDLNLLTGHLTQSYREFWSIKQKSFVRNRANRAAVNSILGHLSPTTFHNKESWGQDYPFCSSSTSQSDIKRAHILLLCLPEVHTVCGSAVEALVGHVWLSDLRGLHTGGCAYCHAHRQAPTE